MKNNMWGPNPFSFLCPLNGGGTDGGLRRNGTRAVFTERSTAPGGPSTAGFRAGRAFGATNHRCSAPPPPCETSPVGLQVVQ